MNHRVLFWYGTAVVIFSSPALAADTAPNSIRPGQVVLQRTGDLGSPRAANQLAAESKLNQLPVLKLSAATMSFLVGAATEARVEQTVLGFSSSSPRAAVRADWESNFAGISVTKSPRSGSQTNSSLDEVTSNVRSAGTPSENRIEAGSSPSESGANE